MKNKKTKSQQYRNSCLGMFFKIHNFKKTHSNTKDIHTCKLFEAAEG